MMNLFAYFLLKTMTFISFSTIISILVSLVISKASCISCVVVLTALTGGKFTVYGTWDDDVMSLGIIVWGLSIIPTGPKL